MATRGSSCFLGTMQDGSYKTLHWSRVTSLYAGWWHPFAKNISDAWLYNNPSKISVRLGWGRALHRVRNLPCIQCNKISPSWSFLFRCVLAVVRLPVSWSLAHGLYKVFQEEHRKPGAPIEVFVALVSQVPAYFTMQRSAANMLSFSADKDVCFALYSSPPLADRNRCDIMVPIQVLRLESKADLFCMNWVSVWILAHCKAGCSFD